jgi:hypothetical protein
MLRGQPTANTAVASEPMAWPTGESPFATAERPAGIRFYRAKESFFRPYLSLRAMHLQEAELTLFFGEEDVVVSGRGLHALYVAAAEHRVAWICDQGQRFATGDNPVGQTSEQLGYGDPSNGEFKSLAVVLCFLRCLPFSPQKATKRTKKKGIGSARLEGPFGHFF